MMQPAEPQDHAELMHRRQDHPAAPAQHVAHDRQRFRLELNVIEKTRARHPNVMDRQRPARPEPKLLKIGVQTLRRRLDAHGPPVGS